MKFGKKITGINYTDRPGAYAVIFDERNQIAVMKTPRGYFLPGGGTDGEDPALALIREIREETGMGVRILKEIGIASQFIYTVGNAEGLYKIGTFFTAALTGKVSEPSESDHDLLWLPVNKAHDILTHDFQKWALMKSLQKLNGSMAINGIGVN